MAEVEVVKKRVWKHLKPKSVLECIEDPSVTLVCILKSLIGMKISIELKTDTEIKGVLEFVDDNMDVKMKECAIKSFEKATQYADKTYIRGNTIRYVPIPDSVDIFKVLENQMLATISKSKYQRKKHVPIMPDFSQPSIIIAGADRKNSLSVQ